MVHGEATGMIATLTALIGPLLQARAISWTSVLASSEIVEPTEEVLNMSWPLPIWATVLFLILAACGTITLYLSERGRAGREVRLLLALIRFLVLALLLWMIAGWSWLRYKTEQPELVIAIDRSASMQTQDAGTPADSTSAAAKNLAVPTPSRFQRAVEIVTQLSNRHAKVLKDRYQLRWATLAETATTLDSQAADSAQALGKISPDGQQSKLGDGLISLLQRQAGRPTAAVILLTDGITTSGSSLAEAANKARLMAIPIHTVAIGQDVAQPDVRLADLLVDDAVFLGDEVHLQATLIGTEIGNLTTNVMLKNSTTSEILDAAKVELTQPQNQQQLRLRFVPTQVGEYAIRIEVSKVAGEANTENNLLERTITVRDQSIRVLLVQKSPSFEFRFLKNLLERTTQPGNADVPAFELHSVLQEADASYVEQDDSAIRLVPSDRQELSKYDVFLFGDFDPMLVSRSSQNAIVEQVSNSGSGLMFIAGRGTPLASLQGWPLTNILPVELKAAARRDAGDEPLESIAWQPTPIGQSALPLQLATSESQNLQLWRQLPGPQWIESLGEIKPAAQILATAQIVDGTSTSGLPLLVSHFAGAGRVVYQASDETYRWMNYSGSDLYYQRYWIQMIRWLSRGRLAQQDDRSQLIVEPRRTNLGEPVRFTARLRPSDVALGSECRITITPLNGQPTTLVLAKVGGSANQFQGTKSDLPPGSYRAVLNEPTATEPPHADFSIIAPPGEQANIKADRETLKLVAARTRGKYYLASEAENLFSALPVGTPVRLGSLPPKPIWNSPWVALAFIFLLTSEWLLRRACRMF